MDAAGGWHVPSVGGGAQGAARDTAWPLAADEGQDGEGAPRLPAAGRGSCCGRLALYPLRGEHSRSGTVLGRTHCAIVPPACAMHVPVPIPAASLSLLPPFPHSQGPPNPPHEGPPSTVTPRHATQSGPGDGMVTLRTYRGADKICENRRECVRQGGRPAAHSHPARPASLCRWWLSPWDPRPAAGCRRGRDPWAFPTRDPPQGHGVGPRDPWQRSAHLCSLS